MVNQSFQHFLSMGGYAFYVWTSYAVVLLMLLALLAATIKRRRFLLKRKKINTAASHQQFEKDTEKLCT